MFGEPFLEVRDAGPWRNISGERRRARRGRAAPVDRNGWGGANNVGGSPRKRGSRLAPQEVERIVRDAIAR